MKNIRDWKKFLNEGETEAAKVKRMRVKQFLDAVEADDVEKCRDLLSLGVNVNAKSRSKKETALHIASEILSIDMMQFLLDNGADPNIKNDRGETPLHRLAGRSIGFFKRGTHVKNRGQADWKKRAIIEAVKLLLASGADPNEKDVYGMSPLSNHCAWNKLEPSNTDLELIDVLIDGGADIDQEDGRGYTPLENSLTYEYTDRKGRVFDTKVTRKLIERGANPFKAFKSLQELIDYFGGDLDWIPEGHAKNAIRRAERSYDLFGED